MSLLIQNKVPRASFGGTGGIKSITNYAPVIIHTKTQENHIKYINMRKFMSSMCEIRFLIWMGETLEMLNIF